MQHVIVTISGPSRSGKDTLVRNAQEALPRSGMPTAIVNAFSSVGEVKDFTAHMAGLCRLPIEVQDPPEPTAEQRQMWADIKAALDRGMDWTVNFLFGGLIHTRDRTVSFYQVRELRNVEKIRDRAVELGMAHIAVFVHRTDPGYDRYFTPSATTDKYDPADMLSFDIVVNNSSLGALQTWGDFLALRIVQALNS